MMYHDQRRRRLLAALGGGSAVLLTGSVGALTLTPPQTAGPFYPTQPPATRDNDLTRVAGRELPARGIITDLDGRLLGERGRPIAGARIEIWQCDANGRYRHPRERASRVADPGFQGFGHTVTDSDGFYRFRTIRPVPYPGRAPHIHFAVYRAGLPVFVTQMYVAGREDNDRDFVVSRLNPEQRAAVMVAFEPVAPPAAVQMKARFDIVVAGKGTLTPEMG